MNLLPPSLCIKINTNGYNIAFVYTELTKLCKNPVKLSLKYYVNSLGEQRKVRRSLPLPDFPLFSLPKELHSLLEKLTPVPLHKNKQHNQWNDICHIRSHLARELHAFSLICLLEKILKSPSIPAGTEHQVNETSEWKQVVADDEILEIQHVAALSERHETTPEIETQHARKRQDRNHHQIDADCLFDRTASQIRCKGYDILEYRCDR